MTGTTTLNDQATRGRPRPDGLSTLEPVSPHVLSQTELVGTIVALRKAASGEEAIALAGRLGVGLDEEGEDILSSYFAATQRMATL